MISAAVACDPEKTAFIDLAHQKPQAVSYGGFYSGACRLASRLRALGLARGARVALMGANSPQWGAACIGIHLSGLTVCPLDPEITRSELENILRFLEPQAVICDRGSAGRFRGLLEPIIELESIDLTPARIDFNPVPIPKTQPLSIVLTSGTTDKPKGVMLSEGNFLHNIRLLLGTKGLIGRDDRILNLLPLHHVYPFTTSLLTALCCGATIIYPRSLKGEDVMAAAWQERATIMVVVPQVLVGLHRRIFSILNEKWLLPRLVFKVLFRLSCIGIERGFRPGRRLLAALHKRMPDLRFIA